MSTKPKVIIHPYASVVGESLLEMLIAEFNSGKWSRFQTAVAFLKPSGHFEDLLAAMAAFAEGGGELFMTFGSDLFSDTQGSDFSALQVLLETFVAYSERVKIFLYHEKGRTFHPKLYLFSNENSDQAWVSIGSSNWSRGGLLDNVEANLLLELNLSLESDLEVFKEIQAVFGNYWIESDEATSKGQGFARRVVLTNIEDFKPLLSPLRELTSDSSQKNEAIKTPKIDNPELDNAESLFAGKRISVPKKFRRKVVRRGQKRPSPTTLPKRYTTPQIAQRQLLWRKPKLAASDVQRQKGHPTGGVRLTQAKWEVDGQVIDQTRYFREDVFGDLEWTVGEIDPKKQEVAIVGATIRIVGEDYGRHDFKVSHKPSGEAGQGNYTTLLHWWGLTDLIKEMNLVGKAFELYAPDEKASEQVYHIEIS